MHPAQGHLAKRLQGPRPMPIGLTGGRDHEEQLGGIRAGKLLEELGKPWPQAAHDKPVVAMCSSPVLSQGTEGTNTTKP